VLSKSLTKWVEGIGKAVNPTHADLLRIGNYFKTQTLERTERGVDADGRAFAPYSEKGPYYYNPSSRNGGPKPKQAAAAKRLLKKIGGPGSGGKVSQSGTSIKFASYAAFKRSLGRSGVDLTGPRAPHMLQALTVRVAEDGKGVVLGIYGDAAARAHGHQYGVPGKLPQRKFLGATPEDRKHALTLLSTLLRGRIKDVRLR
jgi:hypothetical protein